MSGGNRSGDPTLMFLHPVGLDAQCVEFLDLAPVLAPTFPGHGDRRRARAGLTLDDMADEVLGWTSGPMDVVGASLGGMVALHLALNHPERVRSLVLACTTGYVDPLVMEARAEVTETRGSLDMVSDTLARWFSPEVLEREPNDAFVEYVRARLVQMETGALADTWRAIAGHDVLARLAEIGVPTTCIAGLRDLSTPREVMADLANGLPNARLMEMDAPHMAFLEKPQEFSHLVREHLDWVRASVGP